MSDPAVSHHLKVLKNAGLIVNRREGKEIFYKLADTQVAKYIHDREISVSKQKINKNQSGGHWR